MCVCLCIISYMKVYIYVPAYMIFLSTKVSIQKNSHLHPCVPAHV